MVELPPPSIAESLGLFQGYWNGLVWGEGTDFLLDNEIVDLLAYEGRLADEPKPEGDGDITFSRYAAGRNVTLSFSIVGKPLSPSLHQKTVQWERAFEAVDPFAHDWLLFRLPHQVIMLSARVARRRIILAPDASASGRFHAVVELKVSDPRRYNGEATGRHSRFIAFGEDVSGGFDLPTDLPIAMVDSDSGSTLVFHAGNAKAYLLLRIANAADAATPITEVEVRNITTGVTAHFVTTLAAGQTLTADFVRMERHDPGPYVHIGGVSRYADWQPPRESLYLAPGNNLFTASVAGGDPTVRIDWLDTSL